MFIIIILEEKTLYVVLNQERPKVYLGINLLMIGIDYLQKSNPSQILLFLNEIERCIIILSYCVWFDVILGLTFSF